MAAGAQFDDPELFFNGAVEAMHGQLQEKIGADQANASRMRCACGGRADAGDEGPDLKQWGEWADDPVAMAEGVTDLAQGKLKRYAGATALHASSGLSDKASRSMTRPPRPRGRPWPTSLPIPRRTRSAPPDRSPRSPRRRVPAPHARPPTPGGSHPAPRRPRRSARLAARHQRGIAGVDRSRLGPEGPKRWRRLGGITAARLAGLLPLSANCPKVATVESEAAPGPKRRRRLRGEVSLRKDNLSPSARSGFSCGIWCVPDWPRSAG